MFVQRKCQYPFSGVDNSNFSTAFVNLFMQNYWASKSKCLKSIDNLQNNTHKKYYLKKNLSDFNKLGIEHSYMNEAYYTIM